MYLLTWEAEYFGSTHGGDKVFDPIIRLSATLACPCCKDHQKVEGPGHLIAHGQEAADAAGLFDCLDWEIKCLAEQRACTRCGVASVMPEGSVERLRGQAKERVTLEWVAACEKREIERLRTTA